MSRSRAGEAVGLGREREELVWEGEGKREEEGGGSACTHAYAEWER